ncbi:acyl-CoA N-acyltransferase [Hyaloscypha finlandica]|nr:acyl-CoA N-acyltransferase [Hyaloscypha finlandica]
MAMEIPPPIPDPLPPWARPSHTISTPRLILRTALVSDAPAFTKLFSDPINNPFGGVVGQYRSEEQQRENLRKQGGSAGSTARGENAWLVVILKENQPVPEGAEVLKADDGFLIGSTGFNEFKIESDAEGKENVRADVGCLIDWRFQRKGYAFETLEAVIEYGFKEVGAKKITAGTNVVNEPWRKLMDVMGIPVAEMTKDGRPDGEGGSVHYRLREKDWQVAKVKLKKSAKWYLD